MKFTPKTEKEIQDARLLQKGDGDYEITKIEEGLSKSSERPQIVITLKVWDSAGKQGIIKDYIPLDSTDFDWKWRHICYSAGLEKEYETGDIPLHLFTGRTGKLKIGISVDKKGQYPDKNAVADYIVKNISSQLPSEKLKVTEEFEDDIPF